ncbi:MAG: DUF4194 domain-containing protein [Verrucomicrobiaceae bacterium]|nr:DUF4194 domain-containing protein [Verrucomicrobiaceae bacterium]
MSADALPEFHESSLAAVRLLQGVVYSEEEKVWAPLLSHQTRLENYFARLGLTLVVDEPDGFAYLRQLGDDDSRPPGYEMLPVLIPRKSLGYPLTILCVLLRESLRRFEDEELHDERCVVETAALFDDWRGFQKPSNDEVKQQKEFTALLRKAEDDLGFIKKYADEPESWEVRRIIKARLPAQELENLLTQLKSYLGSGPGRDNTRSRDDG